jgi:hypothetical protein
MLSMFMVGAAFATLPLPVYPECGNDMETLHEDCPSDLHEGEWHLLSGIPSYSDESIRESERELGAGLWADQAFQMQTGRYDVVIAVLDSGIEWQNNDLRNKVLINQGELPQPQHADGSPVEDWDLDGNGLFNVSDYAEDPRVDITAGRDAADSVLDPSDLIYTFSDGVDDDGNGYEDDIAGWDFFGDDNDPWNDYDDGFGTHGTGVMREAAAEGDNGGDIGACPNCAILPVRTGDTFVTDGSRAALGVDFAVESGASVVAMAMGALSHPTAGTWAYNNAYESGVLVVAAAGDENSYHHNLPAMMGDALYVHSVRYDGANKEDAYSYMTFLNCNNYGPRIDFSAGTSACATGAVAIISGTAGLLYSHALDLGVDLDAGDVKQILRASVDDIYYTDEELDVHDTYPASKGWDPFYGYGRVNAKKALDVLDSGQIPPSARFVAPEWFLNIDPATVSSLDVVIEAEGDWELSWGQGWEPTEWTSFASGSGDSTVPFDASKVPVAPVPVADANEGTIERIERVHEPAITLLLTTTAGGLEGEARRTLFVYEDPDLKPGYPITLGASGESSPILVDLDGDSILEVLLGTANGEVRGFDGEGVELPGFPLQTDPDPRAGAEGMYEGFLSTVAAGDLDGDGSIEIVAAGLLGGIYAWSSDGERLAGFPVHAVGREPEEFDSTHTYDNGFAAAPTLVDVDNDGDLEILVPGMDSRVYILHHDGVAYDGYPLEVCHPENCGGNAGARIIASTTVGDVDGDGSLDFIVGGNETISGGNFSVTHAINIDSGLPLPGWPRRASGLVAEAALLPLIGTGHPATVAVVDLDGDGALEIIDPVMIGQADVLDAEGEVYLDLGYAQDSFGENAGTSEPGFAALTVNPSVGDIDGDGTPDVFIGGAGTFALVGLALSQNVDFQHVLGGWSGATGESLNGFPRGVEDFQFLVAPAIADIDGDDRPEVIYGSAGFMVNAWNVDGETPDGWPKFTGQWILGSPAIGDIDGDGYVDVLVSTREGYLYAWTTKGRADQDIQWASMHHDARNTSNYHTPLPAQLGPLDVCEGQGCCCRAREEKNVGLRAGLFLLPLLFGWRLRR